MRLGAGIALAFRAIAKEGAARSGGLDIKLIVANERHHLAFVEKTELAEHFAGRHACPNQLFDDVIGNALLRSHDDASPAERQLLIARPPTKIKMPGHTGQFAGYTRRATIIASMPSANR